MELNPHSHIFKTNMVPAACTQHKLLFLCSTLNHGNVQLVACCARPPSIMICPLSVTLSCQTSMLFNRPFTFPILHSFQITSFFFLRSWTTSRRISFNRFLHLRLRVIRKQSFWQDLNPMCSSMYKTFPVSGYVFETSGVTLKGFMFIVGTKSNLMHNCKISNFSLSLTLKEQFA